jgi:TATA-binding protein-associated factor Taf7
VSAASVFGSLSSRPDLQSEPQVCEEVKKEVEEEMEEEEKEEEEEGQEKEERKKRKMVGRGGARL